VTSSADTLSPPPDPAIAILPRIRAIITDPHIILFLVKNPRRRSFNLYRVVVSFISIYSIKYCNTLIHSLKSYTYGSLFHSVYHSERRHVTLKSMIKENTRAPIFSLPDENENIRTLDEFKGSWVILYFYPKDDTPGCTQEACAFRDNFPF